MFLSVTLLLLLLLLLLSLLSPVCRVFTITYLKQTMSLRYIVLAAVLYLHTPRQALGFKQSHIQCVLAYFSGSEMGGA
jgi:hypothetical protein